jgi:hypothetical protein
MVNLHHRPPGDEGQLQRAIADGDILDTALAYRALGMSVFPIRLNGQKEPAAKVLPHVPDPDRPQRTKPSWEPFRDRYATDAEMLNWWRRRWPYGIAAVGGSISGNLAVLDFETGAAFTSWGSRLSDDDREHLRRCPVIGTPRGGAHVYCRLTESVKGSTFARTASGKTLIEVRGKQHYVVAPGSPANCHPSGRCWWIRRPGWLDGDLWEPVPLDVYHSLTVYAADLNEYVLPAAREVVGDRGRGGEVGDRPGDHFNARVNWSEILGPAGWRVFRSSGKVTYWTRPGKPSGVSASTGHCRGPSGNDLFYCFSTSASPFEAEMSYSRFAVYTLLNHRGDYCAATRTLGGAGYGKSGQKAVRQ